MEAFEQSQRDWCRFTEFTFKSFTNTDLHLFCSKTPWTAQPHFLEFESPLNLLAHGCMLKNSNIAKMCTPRVRSGHRWHLCQSKLRHRTCDSLDRFPFHQSGPVKSQQTGKCAVTMHTCEWDAWKKTEETSARGNEKRLRWRNTPTYLQEISIKTVNPHSGSSSDTLQKSHHSQTQLWTTRLATGLIFKIHSDYAVSFPPVAIEEHWRQMERIGVQVKAEREALRASEKQTFLGHLTLRRWVIGPLDIHDKKVGNAQGVECSLSRNISALTVSPKHLCSTFVSSVALGMAASTTWVQSEIF